MSTKALTLACEAVNPLVLGSSSGTLPSFDDIPFNQVHPASRIDNPTDFSRLEGKRRLLKLLLHVPVTEETP